MNESVVFFYFQYVLVNWIYKLWLMFCDTRYLLHWMATKVLCFCVISSFILLMCGFYFNMLSGSDCAVAIPTLGSRGLVRPTNYEECLHQSEWVSEWVSEYSSSSSIVYLYCALLSKGRYWSVYNKGLTWTSTLTNNSHLGEWVSEWVTHLHIGVPITNFVSTLRVFVLTTRLKSKLIKKRLIYNV